MNAITPTSTATVMDHRMHRANGVLLHYVTAGQGEPVVLLHGFAQTWYEWKRSVIPALAEKYFVIAPDMRGVGDLERPMGGYDKRTMAEDIYQLVQHLGLKKAIVIGHDFGGAVAYALAAEHRDFVSKLVIVEMIMPGFGYEACMQHPFVSDGLGPKGLASGLPRRRRHSRSPDFRPRAYVPALVPQQFRLCPRSGSRGGSRRVCALLLGAGRSASA